MTESCIHSTVPSYILRTQFGQSFDTESTRISTNFASYFFLSFQVSFPREFSAVWTRSGAPSTRIGYHSFLLRTGRRLSVRKLLILIQDFREGDPILTKLVICARFFHSDSSCSFGRLGVEYSTPTLIHERQVRAEFRGIRM